MRTTTAIVVAAVAGLAAGVGPAPGVSAAEVRLTGGYDGPLGGGTALVMGPSLIPTPSQRYLDTVDALFLQPRGFTGTTVALTTPESPANLAESEAQGAQILTAAIQRELAAGQVDADNPVVVFGYSQSAALVTFAMQQLYAAGVPSDAVHFVLVGNPANPNGGLLTGLDVPPGTVLPILNIPLGDATPDNLYPVDVYTLEYDGYAAAPRYPLDLLTWLNGLIGLTLTHTSYLGLDPEQIADAIPLETTGDSLANYYMIESESLPLLVPLQWLPVIGTPLYQLLEPSVRILVNLAYGDITDGWNPGPANLPTPVALVPADVDCAEVLTALAGAVTDGVSAFAAELSDPLTYRITPLVEHPSLAAILAAAYAAGIVDSPQPSSVSEVLVAVLDTYLQSVAAA